MNMRGGYDVAEYEKLMAGQMSQQIIPFVESFLAAINEYRENYNSDNAENKGRAQFVHDALNKLTDDDTNGAGLGDLFLNETIYEMAKPKWDALSDKEKENTSFYDINNKVRDSLSESEKNKHADILTIVAQSNGKLTLVMQNILTRGADTNDDTWLDRFESTTYDDLMEVQGGSPSDAMKKLAKKYDDDAQAILDKWDDFQEQLLNYEENVETMENFDEEKAEDINKEVEKLNEKTDEEKATETITDFAVQQLDNAELMNCVQNAAIHDILEETDYLDGSMLDFFSMSKDDIEDDITLLYPLVASLSEGQRSGLEFLSLLDLFNVALTTDDGYQSIDLSKIESTSVYADVDRGIYKKGGVALTSDALRSDAMNKVVEQNDSLFSDSTIAMMVLTGVAAVGTILSVTAYTTLKIDVFTVNRINKLFENSSLTGHMNYAKLKPLLKSEPEMGRAIAKGVKDHTPLNRATNDYAEAYAQKMAPKTNVAGYLSVGFAVAMVVLGVVTTYLSYKDMKAKYNVDFTPIPHYMVDKEDLVGYNAKGEQIVLKNQSAYYKAVETNRKKGDDYFGKIDTCADMNGCVNPQWLALYAAKNEAQTPILADSFKVVVGSNEVPQGYETGIHFFGEGAAFNLNDKRYCWNQKAKSVMVYYKVDKTAATTTGSVFMPSVITANTGNKGSIALYVGGGFILGAAITALCMTASRKKKENKAVTA